MIEKLKGEQGRRLRVELLKRQRMVAGNEQLAERLADIAVPMELQAGDTIIEQGAEDNDLYFILHGACDIIINHKNIMRVSITNGQNHIDMPIRIMCIFQITACFMTPTETDMFAMLVGDGYFLEQYQGLMLT